MHSNARQKKKRKENVRRKFPEQPEQRVSGTMLSEVLNALSNKRNVCAACPDRLARFNMYNAEIQTHIKGSTMRQEILLRISIFISEKFSSVDYTIFQDTVVCPCTLRATWLQFSPGLTLRLWFGFCSVF